jgi:hypothetical protein
MDALIKSTYEAMDQPVLLDSVPAVVFDNAHFNSYGIPANGLFTGSPADNKTTDEATIWGGTADMSFHVQAYTLSDTCANVSQTALNVNKEVAYRVVRSLAADVSALREVRVSVSSESLTSDSTPPFERDWETV